MRKNFKEILKLQKQINKSLSTSKFFHIYKDFLQNIQRKELFNTALFLFKCS